MKFELLISNPGGREKVVTWEGKDGIDAATRYVDCKGGSVIAWREPRVAFVAGVDPHNIVHADHAV